MEKTLKYGFEERKKKIFFFLGFVIKERGATINAHVCECNTDITEAADQKPEKATYKASGLFIRQDREPRFERLE